VPAVAKAAGAVKNAAFEALHPRDKHSGHWVDVEGKMKDIGGRWDPGREAWVVPKSNRAALDSLLAGTDAQVVNVPEGMKVANEADRKRLKVPPAWTDVFVATDPEAKLQVLGRDAAGRSQPRYSAQHTAEAAAKKFAKMKTLVHRLPAVDRALDTDSLKNDDAAALMLIRRMGLRPGSNKDTKALKQAFGATTLQRRHVNVKGDVVRLKFVGKDGVDIDLEVEDAKLARVLKMRLRGKAGTDRLFDTNETKVRRYLENYAPGFTPKDFRTYKGTAEAKSLLADLPVPKNAKEAKAQRNAVGDHVAGLLGNTRAIALKSYIDPTVFGSQEF
jgi:DNA topoisomerase-1